MLVLSLALVFGTTPTLFFVDCDAGSDAAGGTSPDAPFRSIHRAQDAIHAARVASGPTDAFSVEIVGACELDRPLTLSGAADSYVTWRAGARGALLSGGAAVPAAARTTGSDGVVTVNLKALNFTTASLGVLKGRGYAGGSACILTNNYESAAAELFYRRADAVAGAADADAAAATMRVARYPNVQSSGLPSASDWSRVTQVVSKDAAGGGVIALDVPAARMANWSAELTAGGTAWAHGLWAWNWADSHRPIVAVDAAATRVTVTTDDYNHDVDLTAHGGNRGQGGNVYVYNLRSELDAPGEYHVDAGALELAFLPPRAALAPPATASEGAYYVSRLASVVVATGVANVSFVGIEIRHARGGGVVVVDSTDVTLAACTVADHGMMGLNVTGGARCGITDSDVVANGDGGVLLFGGDRQTLTPSGHYAHNVSAHANQRWLMNYAPNVLLGGVGQRLTSAHVYDSPQTGLFMQGNDHVASDSLFERLGRQCTDCGAFYTGREWTYRGNVLRGNTWRAIGASIWCSTVSTIYLDDQLSSVAIEGNTFEGCHIAVELGGGRANSFRYNILNNSGGIRMDDRGGSGTRCCGAGKLPYSFLARVPYNGSAYAKYPGLGDILHDDPCLPKHNVFSDNVLCGGSSSIGVSASDLQKWGSVAVNNTVRATC